MADTGLRVSASKPLAPPRVGYWRDGGAACMLVPPGLDAFVVSPVPWPRWTGALPRLHFRAPFQLLEVARGDRFLRARFRNPDAVERCLAAAVDWPVSDQKKRPKRRT